MSPALRDLAPPLVVECGPCSRRGCYLVARLIERFGAGADLEAVLAALTKDCHLQRDPRLRQGNQYVPRCQARWRDYRVPPTTRPDDQRLTKGIGASWRIDEWLPGRESIAQELAHVSRLNLAHRVFEAAVDLDPHAPITLNQGAMRMRETHRVHVDIDGKGRPPHHDTPTVRDGPAPVARHRRRR